ncbi:uncharacterized protein LOC131694821 [Topomyia yanbarensis]|uniref:uncharacterized protein LOC131694747 n=1 Tax=Topomyia yanbarensis TaxID=2498891 RepID=UPI00273C06C8|nr:uncharacterized protein LOC131679038 isoform X1 [Topomyia yanbarensis]XP_058839219.1 uncharacterized protein LOC131694747 [Topomyia yanbarensis]XP_058839306.1 uncharacterized protein LOC131694821 [Topomyia yanbarensis]
MELRIIDQNFNHLLKIANQLELPVRIVFAISDNNIPAEKFFCMTAQEWSDLLQGVDGEFICSRIADWKNNSGLSSPFIPQMDKCSFLVYDDQQSPDDLHSTGRAGSTKDQPTDLPKDASTNFVDPESDLVIKNNINLLILDLVSYPKYRSLVCATANIS